MIIRVTYLARQDLCEAKTEMREREKKHTRDAREDGRHIEYSSGTQWVQDGDGLEMRMLESLLHEGIKDRTRQPPRGLESRMDGW